MMLSDGDLEAALASGDLVIEPAGTMQPSSIDLTLDDTFLEYGPPDDGYIDPAYMSRTRASLFDSYENFFLRPGGFILASTRERVHLCEKYAARVEGKSSLGRLGLVVHATAGFIDPGFNGQVTLELSNVNSWPIKLTPGMKIAQLCVFELKTPALKPYGHPDYGSKYQGQTGPTASRSWMG